MLRRKLLRRLAGTVLKIHEVCRDKAHPYHTSMNVSSGYVLLLQRKFLKGKSKLRDHTFSSAMSMLQSWSRARALKISQSTEKVRVPWTSRQTLLSEMLPVNGSELYSLETGRDSWMSHAIWEVSGLTRFSSSKLALLRDFDINVCSSRAQPGNGYYSRYFKILALW